MASGIKPEWMTAVSEWAAGKNEIAEVFFYGSRAKGTNRSDSDLDVAVRITGQNETPLTTWIFEGRKWAEELDSLLDVSVHLEMMDETDKVVLPSVRQHGVRIYYRR